jgi:predicted PurR-regulated permease PerM
MKQQSLRTLAVLVLAAAALFVLRELLVPILWATLIAVATWPLRERLRLRPHGHSERVTALVLTGAIVVFVLVPFAFIALRAWRELPALLRLWASSEQAGLPAPAWMAALPLGGQWLARQWNETLGAPGSLGDYAHSLVADLKLSTGRALVTTLAHHAMAFFFCIVVLFFLYLDGAHLAAQADRVALRQFGESGRRTLVLVAGSIRGAVNGLVAVGLGVAVLMTIVYFLAGVPHATALGLATGLLGMVPFGAMLVITVVVVYLFAVGATTAATALAVVGGVAIFIADHFVRPLLMAGEARLPLVLALLGIIGGLETFGVIGLFIGPTLLAVIVAVWRELAGDTAAQAAADAHPPAG